MTDSVLIEGLAVETVIGVYEWEREITQRLLIDLDMAWDNTVPASTDDVAQALDYAAVSGRVASYLDELQPQLLETAAEGLAACLQEEFGIRWLALTIRKPGAVPEARAVGVRIERGRRS
ncbi:dihydroneopterin aldolase [Marinobacter zhejiangensis]|uniref:7,8-dihydroneopterin aldolase n=1 Tax=Marinobacter zhejiangensis TaxID=488535 RepID=A0A1I4MI30_9GAMM|nr:dihydroneopterin aldolase [Marinobacter zhejiangensis]SFM02765.1 dihydroneopterin aldolase [Marinobacter zhejiangensis]